MKMFKQYPMLHITGILLMFLVKRYAAAIEVPPTCQLQQADIIFVMDASSSIGPNNWKKETQFVSNLTKSFSVGSNKVRVGTLLFYKTPYKQFDLKRYSDNKSLSKAILALKYPYSSGTRADLAFDEVIKQSMFSVNSGGRSNVPKILIVITDGRSTIAQKTIESVRKIKSKGIKVFAIGIGNAISKMELNAIASSSSYIFAVKNFTGLAKIEKVFIKVACPVTTTTQKPTTTQFTTPPYPPPVVVPCKTRTKADIILVIDASTSIGPSNWKLQRSFAAGIIDAFTVSQEDVQFGATIFNKDPTLEFYLNTYTNSTGLKNAVNSIEYPNNQGTYTGKALRQVHDIDMFGYNAGGRADAPNILVLLTDGMSNNMTETVNAATVLKTYDDATIITVGIGAAVREEELRSVSSSLKYALKTQDFRLLDYIKAELVRVTCEKAAVL